MLLDTERHSSLSSGEEKNQNIRATCQCSNSGQLLIQGDLKNRRQFLSLYSPSYTGWRNELVIIDTERGIKMTGKFRAELINDYTNITQLPNGDLFCYGGYFEESTYIIDKNYRVKMLPSGISCICIPVLYYKNNVYCFGGYQKTIWCALSRKFDLENNRWINLASLPEADYICNSVIFNGNILISGYLCKNIQLYSIEIDSFSIIPNDFASETVKLLINLDSLYLIEWNYNGSIYESKDGYGWKKISRSGILNEWIYHMYCLYNKGKIYISAKDKYYEFDLKKKRMYEYRVKTI